MLRSSLVCVGVLSACSSVATTTAPETEQEVPAVSNQDPHSAWLGTRRVMETLERVDGGKRTFHVLEIQARSNPAAAIVTLALEVRGEDAVDATRRYVQALDHMRTLPGFQNLESVRSKELGPGRIRVDDLRIALSAPTETQAQSAQVTDHPTVLIRHAAAKGLGPVQISRKNSRSAESVYRVDSQRSASFEVAQVFFDTVEGDPWSSAITRVELKRHGEGWTVEGEITADIEGGA